MEDIQFFGPFEFLVIENYNIGQTMIYTRIRTFDVRRNIDSTKPEDIIMVVLKILREMKTYYMNTFEHFESQADYKREKDRVQNNNKKYDCDIEKENNKNGTE